MIEDIKKPKTHTCSRKVYDLMVSSYLSGEDVFADNIKAPFGGVIKRETVNPLITRLNAKHFPDKKFYTRTINGRLMIGIYMEH